MLVMIHCPNCGSHYRVDIQKVPPKGGYVTCPTCSNRLLARWDYSEGSAGKIRLSPVETKPPASPPEKAPIPEDAPEPAQPGPASAPLQKPGRVHCPRCGLSFYPETEAAKPAESTEREPTGLAVEKVALEKRASEGTIPKRPVPERSTEGTGAPKKAAPAPHPLKRKKILVVDDHEFFRNFAVDILVDEYDMCMAKNIEEALRKIRTEKPDLIILDLGLESGADDGKIILEKMPDRSVPVVIMTGRTDFDIYGDDWRELVALGADDLIIKGMDITDELKKKVHILLHPPIN
jgi:predicted Zn finger-like uncharacterized protein